MCSRDPSRRRVGWDGMGNGGREFEGYQVAYDSTQTLGFGALGSDGALHAAVVALVRSAVICGSESERS